MDKKNLVQELESMVDSFGLLHVMTALDLMCDEKAAWVESSESIGEPDKALGKLWRKCGKACRRVADVASDLP